MQRALEWLFSLMFFAALVCFGALIVMWLLHIDHKSGGHHLPALGYVDCLQLVVIGYFLHPMYHGMASALGSPLRPRKSTPVKPDQPAIYLKKVS